MTDTPSKVQDLTATENSPRQSNSSLATPNDKNSATAVDVKAVDEKADEPPPPNPIKVRSDGKIELTEDMAPHVIGTAFPTWKKWSILSVIFAVQSSMNFNTSVYPNAVAGISEEFQVSKQNARLGQGLFLIAYAFGSELWAPWSEELGRWPILQLSLFLVNIWQLPVALAPNFASLVVGRFLGGLSSAGGSVTLGMVADMWEPDDQQFPLAFVVLSSVGGTTIGPIFGGLIEQYIPSWRWNAWIQLIFGGVVQAAHFFLAPESRATVLLDREARRRRKAGETNIYGPNELKEQRFSTHEILEIWARPFVMFVREPIVLCLSLLSGFSDALIFTFLEGFTPVFEQWGFETYQVGLAFIPIAIGYFLAYASFIYPIKKHNRIRARDPTKLVPEARLWWLLFLVPLEPLGLFGFAWTSLGPPRVHWIAPMIFATLIAISNYAIYFATIDYMVAAYGVYAASATGGNALARDFLAGVSAFYATPLYDNLGPMSLEWASTLLAFLAILVAIPVYIFYWKGAVIRERSKFAQTLAHERSERHGRRVTTMKERANADQMEA